MVFLRTVLCIYVFVFLFTYLQVLPSIIGLIVGKEYFVDNTKYRLLGKIKWDEVSKTKRIKNSSV